MQSTSFSVSSARGLKLALVAAFVALGVVWAGPAAAQSPDQYGSGDMPSGLMVEVTGDLQRLDPDTYGYGEYQITDEETGELYALDDGDEGLLEPYVGQRVTVTGTEPAAGEPPQDPRLLNVIQVEPAGEAPEAPGNTGSITFEVYTRGSVPQGTEFFGAYGEPTDPYAEIPPFGELGVVNLHDSDGDGTYTGVSDVPEGESLALIARGDSSGPGARIYPQSAVQRDATITVDGNETVSTTVSFPEETSAGQQQYDPGDTAPPERSRDTGEVEIEVLPDTGGVSLLLIAAAGLALVSVIVAGVGAAGLIAARRR